MPQSGSDLTRARPIGASVSRLKVTSTALVDGKPMPESYVCKREAPTHKETAPPLAWTAGPPGTLYYAIEMLDLDAPHVPNDWDKSAKNFVHWRVLNIAPETRTSIRDHGLCDE